MSENVPVPVATIKLTAAIRRQAWLILASTLLGGALSYIYLEYAPARYETVARLLVNAPETKGLVDSFTAETNADRVISEDSLANHIDLLRSRKNVEAALRTADLLDLESIRCELDDTQDAVDYVIDNLDAGRGGKGDSRASRTIEVRFKHGQAEDGRRILDSVIKEYLTLLSDQYEQSLAAVGKRAVAVKQRIEEDLRTVQEEFLEQRRNGPILFTGNGGSNAYVDEYQELEKSLAALEIEKATIAERLKKAEAVVAEFSGSAAPIPIEALGVIDTDSLQRLGVFSGLKANASKIADLQGDLPGRTEAARTQYGHLLRLLAEKQRLTADFGDEYPDIKKLDEEILLVQEFLQDRDADEDRELDDPPLTSRQLLDAYVAFLKNEDSLITARTSDLKARVKLAEQQARHLVDFELRDEMLRSRIDRDKLILEGITEEVRRLDLAHGADMMLHEVLESPRTGVKVWPLPAICYSAGLVLGLMIGMFLGLVNDQLRPGFNDGAELDAAIGVPVIGYVRKLPFRRVAGLVPTQKHQSEAFRVLRTILLNEVRSGRLTSLTATSASAGDGKSTVLLNLAASFADLGMTVVFVEADMRRPQVRKRMKLPVRNGLSEILEGKCDVDEALCLAEKSGFSVIHAGGPTRKPSELLESEAFDSLLAELRRRFMLVIVDVGPVLAVCDSLVVSGKVDGTLFIVRPSMDSREQILGAVETLRAADVRLLGTVVNTFGSSAKFEASRYQNYLS